MGGNGVQNLYFIRRKDWSGRQVDTIRSKHCTNTERPVAQCLVHCFVRMPSLPKLGTFPRKCNIIHNLYCYVTMTKVPVKVAHMVLDYPNHPYLQGSFKWHACGYEQYIDVNGVI
jgi:hypothetical protein